MLWWEKLGRLEAEQLNVHYVWAYIYTTHLVGVAAWLGDVPHIGGMIM